MRLFIIFAVSLLVTSSYAQSPNSKREHDPQFIQIFFHFGKFDELDTFHGTYQKDIVPGIAKTTMWLTTREQEIILTKLERLRFFSLPDTVIHLPQNQRISPNLGQQVLRIKYKDMERIITWDFGVGTGQKVMYFIKGIEELLYDIIVSKPEYIALPPAKGGYQ
jgi:hypothetical protein